MVTKPCSFCGHDITKQGYLFRSDSQFCNNACKMSYLNEDVSTQTKLTRYIKTRCENCGNQLEINHRQLVLETVHFCNVDCKGKWLEAAHGLIGQKYFAPTEYQTKMPLRLGKASIFFQGEKYEINSPY